MAIGDASVTQITQAFSAHGPAVQGALLNGATDLFGGLAVIELVWVVGWSVANKTDIFDIMIVVTRFAIGIGFWLWMMKNWTQMASAITRTFWTWGNSAATAAGGTALVTPMNFLNAGGDLAAAIWDGMSIATPGKDMLLVFAGIVVAVIFAFICGLMISVIAEAFLASYLGTVLMAFNASNFTRGFGQSPIRYAIAVGVKLMTLQFIAGLSQGIVTDWATAAKTGGSLTWQDIFFMDSVPLVLAMLAWSGPKIAQDLIIGSHLSVGNPVLALARQIATTAAQVAVSATGGGAAVVAGAQLAGRQMAARTAAGAAPASAAARAATVARLAASNVASAAASDVGRRLGGSYSASHGYAGFRVAADLNKKQP
jgi:type IV secretion system protein TrbL